MVVAYVVIMQCMWIVVPKKRNEGSTVRRQE
jgi:hypothetical protein